ncbi:MAG: hypothetical protein ABIK49_00435 [candidate division WOR-3 bacterium]
MRSRWLYIILAVSLALNLTAITTFAYRRYRVRQKRLGVFRRLKMMAPARMEPIFTEHQKRMDSLRIEYWRARQQLARLIFEEEPETAAVEQTLGRIGEIHKEMNLLVYETARKTGMVLPFEERERLRRRWCEMTEGPHHPAPPGPRHRPPRWKIRQPKY